MKHPTGTYDYIEHAVNRDEINQMIIGAALKLAAMYRGAGLMMSTHSPGPPTVPEAEQLLRRLVNDGLENFHDILDDLPSNADPSTVEAWSPHKGTLSVYCSRRNDGGYVIEISQIVAETFAGDGVPGTASE